MRRVLFLCLIAVGIVFSGCNVQQQAILKSENEINFLNTECFQTIENTDDYSVCLAKDHNWHVYFILHLTCPTSSKKDVFYDGKRITGDHVFIGTYSYENKDGDKKTVQAYMSRENFNEWYSYDKESLNRFLDVLLSYNSVR